MRIGAFISFAGARGDNLMRIRWQSDYASMTHEIGRTSIFRIMASEEGCDGADICRSIAWPHGDFRRSHAASINIYQAKTGIAAYSDFTAPLLICSRLYRVIGHLNKYPAPTLHYRGMARVAGMIRVIAATPLRVR